MLLLTTFAVLLTLYYANGSYDFNTKVVSGVYLRELKGIVKYETKVPLTLEIKLPYFDALIDPPKDCGGEKYLCELANATFSLYNHMKNSRQLSPFFQVLGDVKRQPKGLLNFMGSFFGELYGLETEGHAMEIQHHLSSLENAQSKLASAFEADHSFMAAAIQNITLYAGVMHEFLNQTRADFKSSLTSTYTTNLKNEGRLAYSINQLIEAINLFSTISSTDSGAIECNLNLIPISLIGYKTLTTQFAEFGTRIAKLNLKIASKLITLLSKKIASCVFTRDFVYININVPVTRVDSQLQLFQLTPLHFNDKNRQCIIQDAPKYVFLTSEGATPVDPNFHDSCLVQSERMCQLPSTEHTNGDFAKCAETLFKEHTADDIVDSCTLQCSVSSKKSKIWVTEDEIAFTNYANINISCDSETKQMWLGFLKLQSGHSVIHQFLEGNIES